MTNATNLVKLSGLTIVGKIDLTNLNKKLNALAVVEQKNEILVFFKNKSVRVHPYRNIFEKQNQKQFWFYLDGRPYLATQGFNKVWKA